MGKKKKKANWMETWAWFWGQRMPTAARRVEVGQFAQNHSYTEKLLSPTFVHHFPVFSLPLIFFTLLACFSFQK